METLRGGGAEKVLVACILMLVRLSWTLVRSWMLMVASGWGVLGVSGSWGVTGPDGLSRAVEMGGKGGGGGPGGIALASSHLRAFSSRSSSAARSTSGLLWMSKLSTDLKTREKLKKKRATFTENSLAKKNTDLAFDRLFFLIELLQMLLRYSDGFRSVFESAVLLNFGGMKGRTMCLLTRWETWLVLVSSVSDELLPAWTSGWCSNDDSDLLAAVPRQRKSKLPRLRNPPELWNSRKEEGAKQGRGSRSTDFSSPTECMCIFNQQLKRSQHLLEDPVPTHSSLLSGFNLPICVSSRYYVCLHDQVKSR